MYVYSIENLPIFVGFSYFTLWRKKRQKEQETASSYIYCHPMCVKRLKEVKICREILL